MVFVSRLEQARGKEAKTVFLPMQPGDVPCTYADMDDIAQDLDFWPSTPIKDGLEQFVRWYRDYHFVSASAAA
jgi:UDP-glucuronate 4-epimerase